MTTATAPKQHRLTLRIPEMLQSRFEEAATALGVSLNSFIVSVASREAADVLTKERTIQLTPRDAEFVAKLIENPPAPNDYLLQSAVGLKSRVEL
jgi:uncharacterized protein (DUF1778 family)